MMHLRGGAMINVNRSKDNVDVNDLDTTSVMGASDLENSYKHNYWTSIDTHLDVVKLI